MFVIDLHAGDLQVKVLHAPCHTIGHLLYYLESRTDVNAKPIIFTGEHKGIRPTGLAIFVGIYCFVVVCFFLCPLRSLCSVCRAVSFGVC